MWQKAATTSCGMKHLARIFWIAFPAVDLPTLNWLVLEAPGGDQLQGDDGHPILWSEGWLYMWGGGGSEQ